MSASGSAGARRATRARCGSLLCARRGCRLSPAEQFGRRARKLTGRETVAARSFPRDLTCRMAQSRRAGEGGLSGHRADAAFVRRQLAASRARAARRGALKENYAFYDITAWSLPLAFGVETYWTEDAAAVAVDPVGLSAASAVAGGVQGGRAQIAYIIPYETNAAPALAYRLQREGYRLAVATRRLTAGGGLAARQIVARGSRTRGLRRSVAGRARDECSCLMCTTVLLEGEVGVGRGHRQRSPAVIMWPTRACPRATGALVASTGWRESAITSHSSARVSRL